MQKIRAEQAKQKIILINQQQQKMKESKNSNAQKLKNKGLKIKTEMKTEVESKAFNSRYYHISLDKLADAFEKQFLTGLPDFGQYSVKDQNDMSPESLRERQIMLGISDEKK
jgi:Cft2 family RNA processing exonuclease